MTDYSVISSRVRLARNIVDAMFPSKISDQEVLLVEKAALSAAKEVFEPSFYAVSDLSDVEREYLVDRHLISPALLSSPYGAVILSKDRHLSVMLQEEDHVRAQCICAGSSLKECFDRVKEYDLALRGKARLAYDRKLGFLTACPTNVGTGMRASVMMFLPALSILGRIDELEKDLCEAKLTIRGSFGEGSRGEGYCYQISNAVSLGVTEETILDRVGSAAEKIAKIERDMLELYYEKDHLRIQDSVLRSEAILRSAVLLSQQELEGLIVNLKIGVQLGLLAIDGVNLDELALICKPASLVRLTSCGDSAQERDAARAQTVKKAITSKE